MSSKQKPVAYRIQHNYTDWFYVSTLDELKPEDRQDAEPVYTLPVDQVEVLRAQVAELQSMLVAYEQFVLEHSSGFKAENAELRRVLGVAKEALKSCKPLSEFGRVGTKDIEQAAFQIFINSAMSEIEKVLK